MFITDLNPALGRWNEPRFPEEAMPISRRSTAVIPAVDQSLSYEKIAATISAETPEDSESLPEPSHLPPAKPLRMWEKPEFSFGDFLDVINPLQHIPIVATIYRNMSGDHIGMVPRVIGGALWGKIGGLVVGVINAVVEWFTGKDIGDHIYAAVFRKTGESGAETEVAEAVEPVSEPATTQSALPQQNGERPMHASMLWEKSNAEDPRLEPDVTAGETFLMLSPEGPRVSSAGAVPKTALLPYYRNQKYDKSEEPAHLHVSV